MGLIEISGTRAFFSLLSMTVNTLVLKLSKERRDGNGKLSIEGLTTDECHLLEISRAQLNKIDTNVGATRNLD